MTWSEINVSLKSAYRRNVEVILAFIVQISANIASSFRQITLVSKTKKGPLLPV